MKANRRNAAICLCAAAVLLVGCGKNLTAKMQGSWVKPAENATLEITGRRMALKGMMSLAPSGKQFPIGVDVEYEVVRVEGSVIHLDLVPPNGRRDRIRVTVGDEWLEFRGGDRLWGGRWIRK